MTTRGGAQPLRWIPLWAVPGWSASWRGCGRQGGLPESITVDNGPEFAGKAMDEWAYRRGIKLNFIRPGKPVENAFAESFNGRLRDECLNTNWFMSVRHAREIIEDWRLDYNEVRPHSSLKGKTPKEFIEAVAGLY